jgi:hypothetical protein
MAIDLTILALFVSVILRTIRLPKKVSEQRQMAIQRGVQPSIFTAYTIAVALYAIPFLIYFVLRLGTFRPLWFPLVVLVSHTPALLLADTIDERMEAGFDYQREAGKVIKDAEGVGYISMFAWLALWAVFHFLPS